MKARRDSATLDSMVTYTLLLAAVPLVLVMVRPRAAVVILATAGITWLASGWSFSELESDDIVAMILFFFVLLPMLAVSVAMIVATSLAPRPRMWFDAGFLAVVGWWLGLLVLFFGVALQAVGFAHGPFWDSMVLLAAPGIYAGAGAGFGATNRPIVGGLAAPASGAAN